MCKNFHKEPCNCYTATQDRRNCFSALVSRGWNAANRRVQQFSGSKGENSANNCTTVQTRGGILASMRNSNAKWTHENSKNVTHFHFLSIQDQNYTSLHLTHCSPETGGLTPDGFTCSSSLSHHLAFDRATPRRNPLHLLPLWLILPLLLTLTNSSPCPPLFVACPASLWPSAVSLHLSIIPDAGLINQPRPPPLLRSSPPYLTLSAPPPLHLLRTKNRCHVTSSLIPSAPTPSCENIS